MSWKTSNTFFSKLAFYHFDLWNAIPRHRIELLRQFFCRILFVLPSTRCHYHLEMMFSNFVYGFSNLIKFLQIWSKISLKFARNFPDFGSQYFKIILKGFQRSCIFFFFSIFWRNFKLSFQRSYPPSHPATFFNILQKNFINIDSKYGRIFHRFCNFFFQFCRTLRKFSLKGFIYFFKFAEHFL